MNAFVKLSCRMGRLLVAVGALAMLMQSVGCGFFYRASPVVTSQEGRAYVFSAKDAYVCQVTESARPVCTKTSQQ